MRKWTSRKRELTLFSSRLSEPLFDFARLRRRIAGHTLDHGISMVPTGLSWRTVAKCALYSPAKPRKCRKNHAIAFDQMAQQTNHALPAGYQIDEYRIERRLSLGGFSIVLAGRRRRASRRSGNTCRTAWRCAAKAKSRRTSPRACRRLPLRHEVLLRGRPGTRQALAPQRGARAELLPRQRTVPHGRGPTKAGPLQEYIQRRQNRSPRISYATFSHAC